MKKELNKRKKILRKILSDKDQLLSYIKADGIVVYEAGGMTIGETYATLGHGGQGTVEMTMELSDKLVAKIEEFVKDGCYTFRICDHDEEEGEYRVDFTFTQSVTCIRLRVFMEISLNVHNTIGREVKLTEILK